MLLFNPVTAQQVDRLAASLPQGIMLIGEPGAGLLTTAKHMAGNRLAGLIEPLDKDGQPNHTSGTIAVGRIRDLYIDTRGKSREQRVFIIDNADKMSQSAQNAFLKLLEEPIPTTHFILTSHRPAAVLPTIKSRVEQQTIMPITRQQSQDLLMQLGVTGSKMQQALFVAQGLPAELTRLAQNQLYFETKAGTMAAAKSFLTGNRLQQMQIAFKYSADRNQALVLLESCLKILAATLKTKPAAETVQRSQLLATAYDAIAANGNAKLQLVAAVL